MSNTVIQIRRSNTSPTPGTGLQSGELAFSYNSNNMFIGAQSGPGFTSVLIAGTKFSYLNNFQTPGVTTANAVLVVDGNSYISNVYATNFAVQPTSSAAPSVVITSISNNGISYLGANTLGGGSGNELVTTAGLAAYINTAARTAVGAAQPTDVLFADGSYVNGTPGFTFLKATNAVSIGNTLSVGAQINVGTVTINTDTVQILGSISVPTLTIASNSTFTGIISGNSTTIGHSAILLQNTSSQANLTSTGLYVGATTVDNVSVTTVLVNANLSASYANVSGQTNTGTLYVTTSANIAGATEANSSGVFTTGTVNGSYITAGSGFSANSTLTNAYALNVVTQVNAATGFISGEIQIGSNVVANTTAITFVGNTTTQPTTTISSGGLQSGNSSSLGAPYLEVANASGNTTISTDSIQTSWGLNANSSELSFSGGTISATGADLSVRNASIAGNLTVSGTLTTINTTYIEVADPFIELASNNAAAAVDAVDYGWYGTSNTANTLQFSGMARIAANSAVNDSLFRLFTTTVNPNTSPTLSTNNTYTSTLEAFLAPYGTSGAFTVNSTAISITANTTVPVTIVANTIDISTPLGVPSGGTGLPSLTAAAVLYGNTTGPVGLAPVGANGTVLQVLNNLPQFSTLDGGTF